MNRFVIILVLVVTAAFPYAVSAQTANPGDAIETTSAGQINWTTGEVYATGIGVPPAQAANAAQARAMAQRAAFVVAIRNLLETVKGVRVDSQTVVENFMVKSDVIRTRVDGIVKGARIVKTNTMSDGSVEILVAMPMRGAFMDAVVPQTFGAVVPITPAPVLPVTPSPSPTPQKSIEPKKPEPSKPQPPVTPPATPATKSEQPTKQAVPEPAPSPAPSAGAGSSTVFKGGVPTGLVIDGRGLGLRPALLPRIVDSQGQELYVGHVVTRTNAVEQGVAGYAKDVNAAANNFRVTDNPAIIKGIQAAGSARTDVVVGQADAQMFRQLSGKGDFLQYCRVIIVY